MASKTQVLPAHVEGRARLVEKFGFTADYRPDYPVPPTYKRVQIRDEKHYTPSAQVTKYAAALKNGAKFPPPLFTEDGYLLDGNTTTDAYRKIGQLQMAVLVLGVKWEGASPSDQAALHMLGAAANVQNGRGLDKSEIEQAVLFVAGKTTDGGDDYDSTRIAALLGVTSTTVTTILAVKRARDRATRLGVHVNGSLSQEHWKTLGGKVGNELNDAPYCDLVQLIQETGLSVAELRSLAPEIKNVGDETAQRTLIAGQRAGMQDRIVQYRRTGKSRPSPAARMRQSIGVLNRIYAECQEDLARVVEYSPDAPGYLEDLRVWAGRLSELARLQQEATG